MEADNTRNIKQTLNKSKSQDEPQQEKANSIFIARELIKGDPSQYAKRLLDFKNRKNQNYDKFSEHIYDNLKQSNFTFEKSLQILKDISHQASEQNTTGHQMSCILEGFYRYWRKCNISVNQMQNCFDFITQVYCHLAKKYISICRQLIVKKLEGEFQNFREQALKLVNKYYRGSKVEQDKILPLVYQFDLFSAFGNARVVQIAMRYSNANDITFIFKRGQQKIDYDLVKLFIDKCVYRESKQDLKRCETIVKCLKLDPYDYKNMIQKMVGRYINYQLRTFRLYFIELVVKYDIQLIEALVNQLLNQNRERQAKYFVVKYALQNHYFYGQIDKKQKENLLKIKNILEDNDRFGPTEIDVLEQRFSQEKSILYMKHFGLEESNVTFVDKSNISQIKIQRQFSNKIGMDTETTGGVHVFDEPQMTLIQIFNGRHVYIFDYLNLVGNKHLHNIIKHIFAHCKVYGHDHQKQITSIQKELNLDIEEKVMQELQRNRILDTSKYFKKVFPKETKSNLVYLTEYLLNLTLSKYQQCSGWRNRPLRKAQIHYASLDCIMPLVLGEKMEQIEKSKKK